MEEKHLKKKQHHSRAMKIALWVSAALLLYTLSGFFLVPVVAKYFLEKDLPNVLKRPVHIKKIYFNPFTLDARVDGLEIGNKGTRDELASVQELEVNLQAVSIFKRALVLSEIKLIKPDIHIVQDKKGNFNFEDILSSGKEEPKQESSRPFLFSLNNIKVSDGSIIFTDKLKGVTHRVKNITIGIPFISNLKTKIKIYTRPYFSAVINGSPMEFKAETRPFASDHSTRLRIKLADLDLAHYLAYFSEFINFKIDSGKLSTDLALDFLMAQDGSQSVTLDGNIDVASLALSQAGSPFLAVKALGFQLKPSNLFKKEIWLSKIRVERPRIEVTRYKDGTLNLDMLVKTYKKGPYSGSARSKAPARVVPLDLRVAKASIKAGHIHFKDLATGNGTFEATLDPISLFIKNFGTLKKEPAKIELVLDTSRGEKFSAKGTVGVNPLGADLDLRLDGLPIPAYRPYYSNFFNGQITQGMANISSGLHLVSTGEKVPHLTLSNLAVRVLKLSLGDSTGQKGYPLVHIPEIALNGGQIDMTKRDIHISSISVDSLETQIVVDKQGRMNLAQIVNKVDRPSNNEQSKEEAGGGFHFCLDSFVLKGGKCDFKDVSGSVPVQLLLSGTDVTISNIDNANGKRASFAISSLVGRKGRLKLNGSTDLEIKDLKASVNVERLGLRQFQGYVSRFSNALIYKGRLFANGRLRLVSSGSKGLQVSAHGSSSLAGVTILDPVTKRPLFQWKNIEARDLVFENDPLKLHIKKVLLDRVAGDIFFDRDGKLNLLALMKNDTVKRGEKVTGGAASSKRKSGTKTHQDISVEIVAFKDCALYIKDFSVSPPFVRSITGLNGQIKGLSSRPDMRAQVDIKALADNSATMELKGQINPLAKPVFVDVWLTADGIGMTRFSPYTAKFLGYVVAKGKLTSKVHLVIKGEQIKVDDKVFLDQFDFGHSVESKDAVSLPVKLAIALLKDRQGHINLDIPVRGSLDDPEFSIGGAIIKVIINIFVKAATSPFSLLSAIAGGGEDLQQVEFAPGTSRLSDEAKKKLSKLAKALKDRPALKVELTGYYDPKSDSKGLIDLRFMRLLRKEKMKDLDDEAREKIRSVDDVEVDKEEFNKYLTKAYKEAPFDKPRMFIGLLKKQPPEVMERMLRAHIKVAEGDLKNLALERAQAVYNFLVRREGIDKSRVFLTSARHVDSEKGEKGSIVRLSLK